MRYDSAKHYRRSIRLKGYDYTQAGLYFITICIDQRQCLFGKILARKLILNDFGEIAFNCWEAIPKHFPRIKLDEFIIMPNHIHGILIMTDDMGRGKIGINGRGKAMPCPYEGKFGQPVAGSIPTIIGSYKSAVTKRINMMRNAPGTKLWQRNYYEHIIRNEQSLNRIREYIINNPLSWENDQLHPNNPSKW